MIKSLVGSAFAFVAKPKLFLPALIVAVVNIILAFFALDAFLEIIYNSLVLGIYPEGPLLQIPSLFFNMYPAQITIVILLALITYASSAWLIFAYAKSVKDSKAGIGAILSFGLQNLGNIVSLTLFLFLIALLYGIIFFLFLYLTMSTGLLGLAALILLLGWSLFGIYLLFKLYFLPVIMAVDELRLKQALGRVWQWSGKRLLHIILLIIILEIVSFALAFIGLVAGDFFTDPTLSAIAYYPFAVISIAYCSLVLVSYYSGNKS